jgi:hypothetical protein
MVGRRWKRDCQKVPIGYTSELQRQCGSFALRGWAALAISSPIHSNYKVQPGSTFSPSNLLSQKSSLLTPFSVGRPLSSIRQTCVYSASPDIRVVVLRIFNDSKIVEAIALPSLPSSNSRQLLFLPVAALPARCSLKISLKINGK